MGNLDAQLCNDFQELSSPHLIVMDVNGLNQMLFREFVRCVRGTIRGIKLSSDTRLLIRRNRIDRANR